MGNGDRLINYVAINPSLPESRPAVMHSLFHLFSVGPLSTSGATTTSSMFLSQASSGKFLSSSSEANSHSSQTYMLPLTASSEILKIRAVLMIQQQLPRVRQPQRSRKTSAPQRLGREVALCHRRLTINRLPDYEQLSAPLWLT